MTPMQRVDLLKAACCVAGADGEAEGESAIVQKLAADIGVGKASLDAMLARASRDSDFYKDQFRILKEQPAECMGTLLQVALADGVLSDNEVSVLRNLSGQLGIDQTVFEDLMQQARKLA